MANTDDLAWWSEQFRAHWDVVGNLTALNGEFDLNFRVGDAAYFLDALGDVFAEDVVQQS